MNKYPNSIWRSYDSIIWYISRPLTRWGGRVVRWFWVNFQSGRPTIWLTVGQGLIVLAVGAGGGCLDIFTLICPFSPLSPSFWETARYRMKYCLKGPLNPKQPTNQPLTWRIIVTLHMIVLKVLYTDTR